MAYARLLSLQPPPRGQRLDELANEATDEAVVRVLGHLDDFRGLSTFTTWACQFALTEVSVTLRRHRRYERELLIEPRLVWLVAGTRAGCDDDVERAEVLRLVCEGIADGLSARQRTILRALAIDGQSPDAVADVLGTNAGALYKGLHDARKKLRTYLAGHGLTATGESTAAG
ncbi:MAG: RNA polymerase sigma factor [Gaiellaceae bacterium]